MISVLIVDDESHCIKTFKSLLLNHCPEVTEIVVAKSGFEAIDVLADYHPSLIFLDIEMPEISGFDVLNIIKNKNYDIVFTTAFSEYAIQAIKVNALDYLLKPIDVEELKVAIAKHQYRHEEQKNMVDNYNNLLSQLTSSVNKVSKSYSLVINTHDGVVHLNTSEILYAAGDRNYSWFYLVDGAKIISSKTLREYEDMLENKGFFRTHKSYLVNLAHFKRMLPFDRIELSTGLTMEISRRRRFDLLKVLP